MAVLLAQLHHPGGRLRRQIQPVNIVGEGAGMVERFPRDVVEAALREVPAAALPIQNSTSQFAHNIGAGTVAQPGCAGSRSADITDATTGSLRGTFLFLLSGRAPTVGRSRTMWHSSSLQSLPPKAQQASSQIMTAGSVVGSVPPATATEQCVCIVLSFVRGDEGCPTDLEAGVNTKSGGASVHITTQSNWAAAGVEKGEPGRWLVFATAAATTAATRVCA